MRKAPDRIKERLLHHTARVETVDPIVEAEIMVMAREDMEVARDCAGVARWIAAYLATPMRFSSDA